MVLFWIFTFLVLIEAVKGQFVKSNSTSTAQHARGLCTLAEPPLTVSSDDYSVSYSQNSPERLWVGYVQTYQSFLYRGCVCKSQITKNDSKSNIRDPGQCFSYCGTAIIGIGESFQCFCLTKIPARQELFSPYCTAYCKFPSSAYCGSIHYVSIYERVNHLPSLSSITTNTYCLKYEPHGQSFQWRDCAERYGWLCDDDASGLWYNTHSTFTWLEATRHCLYKKWLPAGLSFNFTSIPKYHANLWTGTIQSFAVKPLSGIPCSDSNFQQGYIEGHQLLFQTNEELNALCLGGNHSATCPSTTTYEPGQEAKITPPDSSTSGPNDTNQTNDTVSVSSITTTVTTTTTTKPRKTTTTTTVTKTGTNISEPNSQTTTLSSTSDGYHPVTDRNGTLKLSKGDDTNVAVYVAVPTALLVVVIVTVLIVLKMRKRCDCLGGKEEDANKTTTLNTVRNAAYQDDVSISPALGTVNHDNFLLEPTNDYVAIRDIETEGVEEGEYDTTKTVLKKATGFPDSGNIYNRLDEFTDDTYDHCEEKTFVSDDTYSHVKGEQKSWPAGGSRAITDTSMSSADDTYSHITIKDSANTALAKTGKAPTDTSEDDTYDHTGAYDTKSPIKAFKRDIKRENVALAGENQHDKEDNMAPNYDHA